MPAAETTTQPNLISTSTPITLEPIRSIGPAALNPGTHQDLCKITLRQLQVARDDPLHQVVTIASDDLLKQPSHLFLASFPADGTLASAIFDFFFKDCDRPHAVCIQPPFTIQLQFPTDVHRVLAWFAASPFRIAHAAARTTAILLLALCFVAAPCLDDADFDDDPRTADCESLHHERSRI